MGGFSSERSELVAIIKVHVDDWRSILRSKEVTEAGWGRGNVMWSL